MPRGYNGIGTATLLLSSGTTSTGATAWQDLQACFTKFSLQCLKTSTGTTAFTVVLQGTLTTATTNPKQLISYTLATDNSSVKFSTASGLPPCSLIRANVTGIAGTSGANGFGVKIYAAALP